MALNAAHDSDDEKGAEFMVQVLDQSEVIDFVGIERLE
jgi:hypothetical protein